MIQVRLVKQFNQQQPETNPSRQPLNQLLLYWGLQSALALSLQLAFKILFKKPLCSALAFLVAHNPLEENDALYLCLSWCQTFPYPRMDKSCYCIYKLTPASSLTPTSVGMQNLGPLAANIEGCFKSGMLTWATTFIICLPNTETSMQIRLTTTFLGQMIIPALLTVANMMEASWFRFEPILISVYMNIASRLRNNQSLSFRITKNQVLASTEH